MESVALFLMLLADPGDGPGRGVLVAASHRESARDAASVAASFARELPGALPGAPPAVDLRWGPDEGVAALARRAPEGTAFTVALVCRDGCSAEITKNGGGSVRRVDGPFSAGEIGAMAARVLRTMMTAPVPPPWPQPVSFARAPKDPGGSALAATVPAEPPASLRLDLCAGAALSGTDVGPAVSLAVGWRVNERWTADAAFGAAPGAAQTHEGSRVEPFEMSFDGGVAFAFLSNGAWSAEGAAGPRLVVTRLDVGYGGGQGTDTIVDWGVWAGASVRYAFAPPFHFLAATKAAYLPLRHEWERESGRGEAEYRVPQGEGSLVLGVGARFF